MAAAIFLLVEEMSGLLSVCDADQHGGVVLPNLKLVRHRPKDAAGHLRKPLFFAHGHVVPLKNALRMKNLIQQLDQDRLPALRAERRDLKREAGGEFVDRQPRKAVGLAEDDAAGVLKAERPPILPPRAAAGGGKTCGRSSRSGRA